MLLLFGEKKTKILTYLLAMLLYMSVHVCQCTMQNVLQLFVMVSAQSQCLFHGIAVRYCLFVDNTAPKICDENYLEPYEHTYIAALSTTSMHVLHGFARYKCSLVCSSIHSFIHLYAGVRSDQLSDRQEDSFIHSSFIPSFVHSFIQILS